MFRTSPVHHQERFVQAAFADLVCGNTRTTRHVQRLESSYNFVTAERVEKSAYFHIPNLQMQLVQNAPDDGPVRSETCRANLSAE